MTAKSAANAVTDVIPFAKYEIASMDRKELKSLMSETLGKLGVTEFDLERIVVPTGGGLAWEITTPEGEVEPVKTFDAVVLNFKHTRSYYDTPYEQGSGSPPACASNDSIVGVGTPGGDCKTCPNAQFGTSLKPGGRGQACSQNMILFIVRPNEIMPSVVKIPPTSIKSIRKALLRLAFQKRVHYYHGVIRFHLTKNKNAQGTIYSEVRLQFLDRIVAKELKVIASELHNGLTPLIEGGDIGRAFLPAPDARNSGQLAAPAQEPRLLDEAEIDSGASVPSPDKVAGKFTEDEQSSSELAEAEAATEPDDNDEPPDFM